MTKIQNKILKNFSAYLNLTLAMALAVTLTACQEPVAQNQTPEISVEEVAKIYAANELKILDVRSLDEYNEGHVPNSVLVPLPDLVSGAAVPYDKNETIYVICRSGNRSMKAVNYLRANGYQNAYSIAGGFMHWSASGHPSEMPQ